MSRNVFENIYIPATSEEDMKALGGKEYTLLPSLEEGKRYELVELSNGRTALVTK